MKKYILAILLLFIAGNVFASDAQRQTSKYTTSGATAIQSTSGKVFSVSMISSGAAAGWVALYDSATQVALGAKPKIEIQTATQYDTAIKEFPEGLVFHNGIYLEASNATTIVYYH